MTKIVVLDFDGVICPWPLRSDTFKRDRISLEDCLQNLNSLISKTSAKIVISSSWKDTYDLQELTELLKKDGFVGEVIGVIPTLSPHSLYTSQLIISKSPRGKEIWAWFEENTEINVESYVILDDECFVTKDWMEGHEKHLVPIDGDLGLLSDDVEKAIKILEQ